MLDQASLAYRFGFVKDATYYDWNTSFDVSYGKHSPGLVLLGEAIRWCYGQHLQRFDFMRGSEPYKLNWNTSVCSLYSIECSRSAFGVNPVPGRPVNGTIDTRKGVVLDLDGVVYRGKQPILSTVQTLRDLRARRVPVGYLTNTSSLTAEQIVHKLQGFGIDADPDFVMTSAEAVAHYCLQKGYEKCLVVGGHPALPTGLVQNGIAALKPGSTGKVDAVIVGYQTAFCYSQLLSASEAIDLGAAFVCTDRDRLFASEGRMKPGTGWIVAAIETVTGAAPFVAGKPNDYSLRLLLSRMGLSPAEVLLIGDSVETDVAAAKKAGALACLFLGGVTSLRQAARCPNIERPDLVIDDIGEIANKLDYEHAKQQTGNP